MAELWFAVYNTRLPIGILPERCEHHLEDGQLCNGTIPIFPRWAGSTAQHPGSPYRTVSGHSYGYSSMNAVYANQSL